MFNSQTCTAHQIDSTERSIGHQAPDGTGSTPKHLGDIARAIESRDPFHTHILERHLTRRIVRGWYDVDNACPTRVFVYPHACSINGRALTPYNGDTDCFWWGIEPQDSDSLARAILKELELPRETVKTLWPGMAAWLASLPHDSFEFNLAAVQLWVYEHDTAARNLLRMGMERAL